ncbi:MAG: hypothetical protein Fur0042_23870 [Cyanophyceae cyanobacterium]
MTDSSHGLPPAPTPLPPNSPRAPGWTGLGWLVLWTAIAAGLRFWHLDLKPPSSIEIATVGFSLGNGFGAVPIDQLVPPEALLAALRLDPTVSIAQLLDRLADQSTHPPLFFLLMRGWLTALTPPGAEVTWTVARSLSALLGVAAVPLAAALAGTIARSRRAAFWAPPLMALSPYGVYLSQEARHYTLAALLAMGSWILAVRSARRFDRDRPPAAPMADHRPPDLQGRFGAIAELSLWALLNGLGMATHYLYGLVTVTQGLLFGALAIARVRRWGWRSLRGRVGAGLGLLAALQGATIALWIPFMRRASESEMTEWVGDHLSGGDLLMVPLRLILWLLSMVMLLPIERQPWPIAIASGLLLLGGAIALGTLVWRRFGRRRDQPSRQDSTQEPAQIHSSPDRVGRWALGAGVGGALAIFLLMAYSGRADLSVAPRYQFTYFPLVIAAIAIALAPTVEPLTFIAPVRRLLLVMGAVGSLCVVQDLGFQKSIHSDRLWEIVAAAVRPAAPVIVVTPLDSLSEVRSAIAIAAESAHHRLPRNRLAMMLLSDRADRNDDTSPLAALLAALPPQADLWTVGDAPHLDLEQRHCQRQPDPPEEVGERLRHFHCDRPQP